MDSIRRLPTGIAVIGDGTDNRVLDVSLGGEIEWSLRSSEFRGIQPLWAAQPHAFTNANSVATSTPADCGTP